MEVELSLSEQQELNQIAELLKIDDSIKALSEKLFKEFKSKKSNQFSNEKSLLTVASSVLISAKSSQDSVTIRQILNTLKNVSKQEQNAEEFLTVLKQFITQVSVSKEIVADLKGTINRFVISFTLYLKYQEIFNKLDFQSSSSSSFTPHDYFVSLKNFGWLIYLYVRDLTHPNQISLIDAMFIILESITQLAYCSPNSIVPKYFEQNGKNPCAANNESQKKDEDVIQETVFQLIKLNVTDDVINSTKSFKENLFKLIENKIIQSANEKTFDGMVDPSIINSNLKNFEDHYLKNLSEDALDERFYREELSKRPPNSGRSTPLVKQTPQPNKLNINVNITNEDDKGVTRSSYRPLNYEVSEQMKLGSHLRDIKNSIKAVPASPAMTPQRNLVSATPMSKALEMYKWLNEKLKLRKNDAGFPPVLDKYLSATENQKEEILKRANSILDCEQGSAANYDAQIKKQIKDKQHQIMNLYYKVLEDLLVHEERKAKKVQYSEIIRNDVFHRALIAASIETVFFVNNYNDLSFAMLLELCNIHSFEFWRIIASFVKFDSNMPHPLRKHFNDLEVKILMHLAWKKNSPVLDVVNHFIEQSKNEKKKAQQQQQQQQASSQSDTHVEDNSNSSTNFISESSSGSNKKEDKPVDLTHSQALFFKRLLHHVAVQICQICDKLNIGDHAAESVWQAIQNVLGDHTLLLVERHVAQLILCCIYGVCKSLKHPVKFQDLINKYQELPVFQKDEYYEIVHSVHVKEGEKCDLITFYNKIFIVEMKSFILSFAQSKTPQPSATATPVLKPLVPPLVQSSPLKDFLSTHALFAGAASQENRTTPSIAKFGMTPKTKALYAFGESPGCFLDSINKVTSKRHIDYEESQEGSRKHVKTPSSIMDKIIGNVGIKESAEMTKPIPSKRNLFGTNPNASGNTKKMSDESSQSQSLLASESSNTSTISLPIPENGTRSLTSSLAGNIEKFNMNSDSSKTKISE